MKSAREGSPGRRAGRRGRLIAAVAVSGGLALATGCQVEYAGMTLPSGKYMYDDVQYFANGPGFRWANTNAATQRARMRQMGYDVSDLPIPGTPAGPALSPPPAEGTLDPTQNRAGMPTNVNVQAVPPGGEELPPPNAPNAAPFPGPAGGMVPPPGVND